MTKQKITFGKGGCVTNKKKYKQTFNLKFRDDAAQYFALLDFLQQNNIRFLVRDNEHLRIIECNEKFAPVIENFMSNEEVVQFARAFAQTQANGYVKFA